MTDYDALVAELRAYGGTWTDGPLGLRAADAIEELRAQLAETDLQRQTRLFAEYSSERCLRAEAERDAARAELARLNEAFTSGYPYGTLVERERDDALEHLDAARAELAGAKDYCDALGQMLSLSRARLDAVLALCDEYRRIQGSGHDYCVPEYKVRAAATGETR